MTCVKDTRPPVPEEVMKAISDRHSVLILRQAHMPLPPAPQRGCDNAGRQRAALGAGKRTKPF